MQSAHDPARQLADHARPILGAGGERDGVGAKCLAVGAAGNLAAAVRWYLAHDPEPLPHLFRVLCPSGPNGITSATPAPGSTSCSSPVRQRATVGSGQPAADQIEVDPR